jgi:hypothetical protein
VQRSTVLFVGLGVAIVLYLLARTDKGNAIAIETVGAVSDAASSLGAFVASFTQRGLRLNNPGNIRHNASNQWVGMAAEQPDAAFVKFEHPAYGVRALGRVLTSYSHRGKRTVATLINTWAPPSENNTASYVGAVTRELKVAPDDALDVRVWLPRLAGAIIKHENGLQPYAPSDIEKWVYMS